MSRPGVVRAGSSAVVRGCARPGPGHGVEPCRLPSSAPWSPGQGDARIRIPALVDTDVVAGVISAIIAGLLMRRAWPGQGSRTSSSERCPCWRPGARTGYITTVMALPVRTTTAWLGHFTSSPTSFSVPGEVSKSVSLSGECPPGRAARADPREVAMLGHPSRSRSSCPEAFPPPAGAPAGV